MDKQHTDTGPNQHPSPLESDFRRACPSLNEIVREAWKDEPIALVSGEEDAISHTATLVRPQIDALEEAQPLSDAQRQKLSRVIAEVWAYQLDWDEVEKHALLWRKRLGQESKIKKLTAKARDLQSNSRLLQVSLTSLNIKNAQLDLLFESLDDILNPIAIERTGLDVIARCRSRFETHKRQLPPLDHLAIRVYDFLMIECRWNHKTDAYVLIADIGNFYKHWNVDVTRSNQGINVFRNSTAVRNRIRRILKTRDTSPKNS
jgi:hypothetical protein